MFQARRVLDGMEKARRLAAGRAMDGLIAPDEEPVVEIREGGGPLFIICEHASNRLPRALGDLGLAPSDLTRHIAWDPGAADLATGIASRLDATLVMQRFSRLAIDCNREPSLPDAITSFSEDTAIPGNIGLSGEAKASRVKGLWAPFHAALDRLIDKRRAARRLMGVVTVHSFTPVYRGVARPWHVGIISSGDRRFAEAMLAALRRDPKLVVGDDQPYSAKDNVDYTIRRHGFERGLPHVMIEVRNDLLRAARDVAAWTERLSEALREGAGVVGLAPAAGVGADAT
jgi:predicted N-formylglutamate amidohydrolase